MALELCDTAKLLCSVLDGTSEIGLLVANDGTVLHQNRAASKRLRFHDSSPHRMADLFVFFSSRSTVPGGETTTEPETLCSSTSTDESFWQHATHCQIINRDGTTSDDDIPLTVTKLSLSDKEYYSVFVCNKQERFRETMDASFDPVVTIDETGRISTVNQSTLDLFGYTKNEMVGQNVSMICGGEHAEYHSQYIKAYLDSGVEKVIGKRREVPARRKDGTEFHVELGIKKISSDASSGQRYFCGFLKDLTAQKKHQLELEEAAARAQGMINASFTPMFEIDETAIIRVVNNAACSMFGYTREEFLGSNISMICGDDHAGKHDSYLKHYLQTGERKIIGRKRQVKARRKDGSEFDVELGVEEVRLSTTGKRVFCGFINDLTQQKLDKRALQKQAAVINAQFFAT
jgi:PAS domain S-box-containing protein